MCGFCDVAVSLPCTDVVTQGRYWRQYASACVTAGDVEKAGEVIGRAIQLDNTDMDLWLFYVRYVVDNVLKGPEEQLEDARRRNDLVGIAAAKDVVLNARITVTQAFDLAVDKVGPCVNAAPLWREYIAFLKKGPVRGGTSQSVACVCVIGRSCECV
jgi:hypothetical protein